jgi:hypothetical protein
MKLAFSCHSYSFLQPVTGREGGTFLGSEAATDSISESKAEVRGALKALMQTLHIRSEACAALLRNPGDHFPSGAYVRLMLGDNNQEPSTRFADLVKARLAEVQDQLRAGVQAVQITEGVVQAFHVEPKQHIITLIPEAKLAEYQYQRITEMGPVFLAALAMPAEWVTQCRICGRWFPRRNNRQTVCRLPDEHGRQWCVREANRQRRKNLYKANQEGTANG